MQRKIATTAALILSASVALVFTAGITSADAQTNPGGDPPVRIIYGNPAL